MEICEVNFTGLEYYDDYENDGGSNNNIWTKIIGLAMYLIGCLGLFLFIGIIHYEKFGQDSQKRSFPGMYVATFKEVAFSFCHWSKYIRHFS